MHFYLVYIREAHAVDGPRPIPGNVEASEPTTLDERAENAGACLLGLNLPFPAVLDTMDNKAAIDYAAWPDRLYLIDTGGKVAYKSAPGPAGFKPDDLGRAIAALLPGPPD